MGCAVLYNPFIQDFSLQCLTGEGAQADVVKQMPCVQVAEGTGDSSLPLSLLCGRRISVAQEERCSAGLRGVALGPDY